MSNSRRAAKIAKGEGTRSPGEMDFCPARRFASLPRAPRKRESIEFELETSNIERWGRGSRWCAALTLSRCARRAARFAPGARKAAQPPARTPLLSLFPGARAAPHASRRARGKQHSRLPGNKTSEKSWMARSRSANKMADLQRLTEQARAFPQRSAGGPASQSERAPTKVSTARRRRRASFSPSGFVTARRSAALFDCGHVEACEHTQR